ncbi:hypothetical protein V1477_018348 [Vespula maculifrons]|uniref:Uncharacterized protein n=1 Tax=Vespula maculifrons TaxID=7453 RepID=A0ABD2AZL5_VESMC
MVDDDDGVGLRTDGPLISLKTHEDSQGHRGGCSLNPGLEGFSMVLACGPSTVPTTICRAKAYEGRDFIPLDISVAMHRPIFDITIQVHIGSLYPVRRTNKIEEERRCPVSLSQDEDVKIGRKSRHSNKLHIGTDLI